MRGHIKEQIDFRIKFMDKECYNQGSCKLCGCRTTALQMANKACDKPCYPEMMDSKKWNKFKDGDLLFLDDNGIWELFPSDMSKLILYRKKKGTKYFEPTIIYMQSN